MIDGILRGLFVGFLSDRLAKLVPPKKSDFDQIPYDELKRRNNWIELGGSFILIGSLLLIWLWLVNIGLNHDPWRIGFLFCFLLTLTHFFVTIVTLPKGLKRFSEFWRYHELKHRTRLALLLCLEIPFSIVGVISAFEVFASLSFGS
jgi:hypothetical protein